MAKAKAFYAFMSCRPKSPIFQLSAYFHYSLTAPLMIVGPSGSGSQGDWYELESIEPYLARACGYYYCRPYLAEWHAREIIRRHKLPLKNLKVHLELEYNPTEPVYLLHV